MWLMIFAVLLALTVGGIVYLLTRMRRFACVQRIAEQHRLLSWLVCLLPFAAIGCLYAVNVFAVIIALLHLFFIWLFCDLIAWIIRKCAKKQRTKYYEGAAALLLTTAVLAAGWFFAHHVYETRYMLETEKTLPGGQLRIGMIADSHIGVTLSGEDFAREIERLQAAEPDLVVIVGDFVDDDTARADMFTAAEGLGRLTPQYGTYFVFGNHDKGYYQNHAFTTEELRDALSRSHVTVLEDAAALPVPEIAVIGRQDRGAGSRTEIQALAEPLDPACYQIVLDHQPNDYASEAAAKVDLVLSGHTHGGHIFPAGYIGLWMGANDFVYGKTRRDGTDFIVTSGISGWAIPFKTGAISEYIVIDITQKQ